jgi:NADPH2:quinone reductase
MKAIAMIATGAPHVLAPIDVPKPKITQPTEMLVRLRAAGVNPIDTKLRSKGTYYPGRLPAILGCDGAGVVEAAGGAVKNFRVGDAVYFCNGGIGGHPGNYAEYALVDERFAALKPASLSFIEAAAVPLVFITAWEALHDRARLQPRQHVLIHAGAGGVGHAAIQLAKLAGTMVATTVSDEDKAAFVRRLGADEVILYRQADFVHAALAWTNGAGVDVALDTVGGAVFAATTAAVRLYGTLITLLQPGPDMDWKEARQRNLLIGYELMLSPMYYGDVLAQTHQADILRECARLFDAGALSVQVSHVFPLDEAVAAHRLIEQGGQLGKIVLTIDS